MRLYCLYCFATIEKDRACPDCGHHSSPADRTRYWNRHPRLRQLESGLKVASTALMAMLVPLFLQVGGGSGTSGGFFLLMPAFALAPIWLTISGLTRVQPHFLPTAMWSFVAIGLGIAFSFQHWTGWLFAFAGFVLVQGCSLALHNWKAGLQNEGPPRRSAVIP